MNLLYNKGKFGKEYHKTKSMICKESSSIKYAAKCLRNKKNKKILSFKNKLQSWKLNGKICKKN